MVTSSVRIRLSDEERNRLDTIARNLQISRSALIRQLSMQGYQIKRMRKWFVGIMILLRLYAI